MQRSRIEELERTQVDSAARLEQSLNALSNSVSDREASRRRIEELHERHAAQIAEVQPRMRDSSEASGQVDQDKVDMILRLEEKMVSLQSSMVERNDTLRAKVEEIQQRQVDSITNLERTVESLSNSVDADRVREISREVCTDMIKSMDTRLDALGQLEANVSNSISTVESRLEIIQKEFAEKLSDQVTSIESVRHKQEVHSDVAQQQTKDLVDLRNGSMQQAALVKRIEELEKTTDMMATDLASRCASADPSLAPDGKRSQDNALSIEEICAQSRRLAGRIENIEKSMETHVQRTNEARLHDERTVSEVSAQARTLASRLDSIDLTLHKQTKSIDNAAAVDRTLDISRSEASGHSLTLANRLDGIELAIDQQAKRNNSLEDLLQLANSQTDKLQQTLAETQQISSALQLEVAAKQDDRERIANSVASVHGQLQQAMDLFSGGQAHVDSVLADCDNLRRTMEALQKVHSKFVQDGIGVQDTTNQRRKNSASSTSCFSCLDSK